MEAKLSLAFPKPSQSAGLELVRPLSTYYLSPPDSNLISDTSWRTTARTDKEVGAEKAGKRKEMREVVTVVQWKMKHRFPQTKVQGHL